MVREPDATMQPTLQDNQLMSTHRVLGFKPQLRLEWRGQDGQNETKQPDHTASLGDSITSSTRIRFSVHTGLAGNRQRRRHRAAVAEIDELSEKAITQPPALLQNAKRRPSLASRLASFATSVS
jgi:hypothetical protein